MLVLDVSDLLNEDEAVRLVLDNSTREVLREHIRNKFGTFRSFSEHEKIKFDTFHNWIRLDKKRRQPRLKDLMRIFDNNIPNIYNKKIVFYQLNNSTINKNLLPSKIIIDENFMLGLGIYIAEGNKRSSKKILISNTNSNIITFFNEWLSRYFGVKKEELYIYVYSPEKEFDENSLKKKYAKLLGVSNSQIRVYYNRNSSKECMMTAVYNAFLKRILDGVIKNFDKLVDDKTAGSFITGVLSGDGSISFDPDGYYEICIALGDNEVELAKKALDIIRVSYLSRYKNNVNLLLIHRKSNFTKILEIGGFGTFDDKNKVLKAAISNYKFER